MIQNYGTLFLLGFVSLTPTYGLFLPDMKNPDKEQSEPLLKKLLGKRFAGTLVCNSIKLSIETDTSKNYVWIDPPWEFFQKNYKITSSSEAPRPSEEDYPLKFRIWCGLLSSLDSVMFINYAFTPKDDLLLEFDKGYKLIIPFTIPDPEEPLWYSHWYADEKRIILSENS